MQSITPILEPTHIIFNNSMCNEKVTKFSPGNNSYILHKSKSKILMSTEEKKYIRKLYPLSSQRGIVVITFYLVLYFVAILNESDVLAI